MTKEFFTATPVQQVFDRIFEFAPAGTEKLPTAGAWGRILAMDVVAQTDLPGFARATMDGYALRAAATFGASESSPAYLEIIDTVHMGMAAQNPVGHGQAAGIATGGMLPRGADAVVMLEHAAKLDETALEVYKSVAPGANVVAADEDVAAGQKVLSAGSRIRPQEMGLMAALGMESIRVFKKPVIGIISTGDELVEISQTPGPGQIRDVNTYSLAGCVAQAGGNARTYGIVSDRFDALRDTCARALAECDMVLISGGSSVGTRDLTLEVIESLPDSQILFHGIPIRPGKPTILAKIGQKALWGLPGQIASAMVVFDRIVAAFVKHISGSALPAPRHERIPAVLTRNLASAQGRTDYVRARIVEQQGRFYAEPIPGPSGLIRTLVAADGLIEIDMNTEGLEKGETVFVTLLR
ncbi:MAG: gephyrin-like molybdotransferase Glp [Desulfosalsimonas sp.]